MRYTDSERWLPVTGLEGCYEVSNHGNVRSLAQSTRIKNGGTRMLPGRMLKPFFVSNNGNRQGHLAVTLGRGNRRKVHRLVLEAFVGPRPDGMIGCHRDDDPKNNHVSNLYWGTYTDNALDAARNGNSPQFQRKEFCNKGHRRDGVRPNGQRYCPTCDRGYQRAYRERRRVHNVNTTQEGAA